MTARRGRTTTRAKDISDAVRGSAFLLALWAALIAILAAPIYLAATFVDGLSVMMLIVVSTISLLVHIYSTD